MEATTSLNQRPNELMIPDEEAYARIDIEVAQVAEFLMAKLEPVDIETLDPEDRRCPICQEEFHVSDDVKLSHAPVRTVCNHVFGKPCIIKWLDVFFYFGDRTRVDRSSHGNTSCPACRREFFPKAILEGMEYLAARLWLWDNAYDIAGVARSAREERSRKYLWEYVRYCHAVNDFQVSSQFEYWLLGGAQRLLLDYCEILQTQALTPLQEDLRAKLQGLAETDLRTIIAGVEGASSYASFVVVPQSHPAARIEVIDLTMDDSDEDTTDSDEVEADDIEYIDLTMDSSSEDEVDDEDTEIE